MEVQEVSVLENRSTDVFYNTTGDRKKNATTSNEQPIK